MKTFSFRAECPHDVDAFQLELIRSAAGEGNMRVIPLMLDTKPPRPDIEVGVELMTTLELEQVRDVMRKIDDSHVMLQTLRELPFTENTLERDRSIW